MSIPSITVWIEEEEKSLSEVCKGRKGVIDFWTTKCVRCPAALGKLNEEAAGTDALYIACALSQGEGNKEDVMDFTQDWENLTHVFAEIDVKEEMKATFGFTAVPFYVVFDEDGTIVGSGESKTFNYTTCLSFIQSKSVLDENKITNTADAPDVVGPTTATTTSALLNVFSLDEDF